MDVFSQQKANVGTITYGRDGAWHVLYLNALPKVPDSVAMIAGDCLNNIRAALDHLVCQLVLREDQEPGRDHQFPICQTKKNFVDRFELSSKKSHKRNALRGIPRNGDVWALIKGAQPFNSPHPGLEPLTLLNLLTNVDKHNALLVQRTFLDQEAFISRLHWRSDVQPIDRRFSTFPLSEENKTEIIRVRFASEIATDLSPYMEVEGGIPM
jgi:hypothetical protein